MTLSYELCVELKGNKFWEYSPYFRCELGYLTEKTIVKADDVRKGLITKPNGEYINIADELVSIPTLSQLIEACGDDLDVLIRTGRIWTVGIDSNGHIFEPRGEGETPEEAVCRLWICLNSDTIKK